MNRRIIGFILWSGVTFALAIFFLQVQTTSKGFENGPSFRLNFGWSEVTGELLNIKCADPAPEKVISYGLPFAFKYTEHICSGVNEITATRQNTVAIFVNAIIAALFSLIVVFMGIHYFWREQFYS